MMLPFLVGAARVLVHDAPGPGGDLSHLELRVRDVGGPDTPLVGSYQRFGWNQPGPAWLWALAVPYRAAGSRFAGMQLGALSLGAVSVAVIAAVAWRRGGLPGVVWSMTVVGVLVVGRGGRWWSNPWEPNVSVLAVLALAILAWDVILGGRWTVPAFGLLATFCVQMYVPLVPVTVALVAAGLAGRLAYRHLAASGLGPGPDGPEPSGGPAPPPHSPRRRWLPAAVTLGLVALAWVPPLLEEARHPSGNLWRMWRFFTTPRPTLGLADAARAVAIELGTGAQWLGRPPRYEPFTSLVDTAAAPVVPVGLVVLVVTTVAAARRRHDAAWFGGAALVAAAAVTAGLSRLVDPLFSWTVAPTFAVGALTWLAAGWCAAAAMPASWRTRLTTGPAAVGLLGAGVAAVGALAVAGAISAARAADGPDRWSPTRTLRALGTEVAPTARRAGGPVLVEGQVIGRDLLLDQLGVEDLVLFLERRGVPTRVGAELDFRYGRHRARPHEAVLTLRVVRAGAPVPPGWRRLAVHDPLPPATRAELERRERALAEARRRYGPDDPRTQAAFLAVLDLPRSPALAVIARPR
jgi:hypothetical protein